MGQGFSFLFGSVESVTALDASTVQFKTTEPFAPLVASLMRLAIVDKDDVQANTVDGNYGDNGDYGEAYLLSTSAGTGAYKLSEHDPNVKTVLVKNDDYFQGHNAKAPDEVIIKYSVEAATIKALLLRGEHEISSMWLPNEVLAALSKYDTRMRVFQCPRNLGTYWAKNYGMMQARGKFVTFMDSDDLSSEERIRRVVKELLSDPNLVMTFCDYVRINSSDGKVVLNRGEIQRGALIGMAFDKNEVIFDSTAYPSGTSPNVSRRICSN